MVPEKSLESLLDCKEIKPAKLKQNQFRIFIGRSVADDEAPICNKIRQTNRIRDSPEIDTDACI